MATTAQTLIDQALTLLRVKSPDTSVSNAEYADALIVLNNMLDSWANDSDLLTSLTRYEFTPTGANPQTIGATGTHATTRPLKVVSAYYYSGSVGRVPVQVVPFPKLLEMGQRTFSDTSSVAALAYRPIQANGELWMLPALNAGTVGVVYRAPLYTFALISTSQTLAPGHDRAIIYNLAVDLAPQYQVSPGEDVLRIATESKQEIANSAEEVA